MDSKSALSWWALGYAALLAAVFWSMFTARRWALAEMSTADSIADWQAWREDVRSQQGEPGPVERRIPKSTEPPALVLMRDYFAVSLAGALLFSSLLFWVIAWFVTGVFGAMNDER